jgi:phosphoglycolate phosphatase
MSSTLLLFDIDGTLVEGSAEGIGAFVRTIRDVCGRTVPDTFHDTAGKTDLLILRELLEHAGIVPREELESVLLATYLEHAEALIRKRPGWVLPGVRALLERLQRENGVVVGLGTGNLERAARLKLRLHGLDGFFDIGGFGDVALLRRNVIAAGIRTASQKLEISFERIAVVGDTPRDINAARANGVYSIAVATGKYSVADLRNHGASVVVKNMSRPDLFMSVLAQLT